MKWPGVINEWIAVPCVIVPFFLLHSDGDVNLFSLSDFDRDVFDTFCFSRLRLGSLETETDVKQKRNKEQGCHLDLRLSCWSNHFSVWQIFWMTGKICEQNCDLLLKLVLLLMSPCNVYQRCGNRRPARCCNCVSKWWTIFFIRLWLLLADSEQCVLLFLPYIYRHWLGTQHYKYQLSPNVCIYFGLQAGEVVNISPAWHYSDN